VLVTDGPYVETKEHIGGYRRAAPVATAGGPVALPSLYSRKAGPEFDKASKKFSGRCFAVSSE